MTTKGKIKSVSKENSNKEVLNFLQCNIIPGHIAKTRQAN
jgi:hypothetical protein